MNINMTGTEVLITVLGATTSLLVVMVGYFFTRNKNLRKEAAENLISNTESKLATSIQYLKNTVESISNKIDKTDEKIDKLVSKSELDSAMTLLENKLANELEKKMIELDGQVKRAEDAYRNAEIEARGMKQQSRALLGKNVDMLKPILDFAHKNSLDKKEVSSLKKFILEHNKLKKESAKERKK